MRVTSLGRVADVIVAVVTKGYIDDSPLSEVFHVSHLVVES